MNTNAHSLQAHDPVRADALARGFDPLEAGLLARLVAEGAVPELPLDGEAAAGGRRAAFAPMADRTPGLYAIVDSADWVRRVLAHGVRLVQLRIKDAPADDLLRQVRDSVAAAREAGAQLFINDHWEAALDAGAYGVHLGQEDLATADLDRLQAAGLRLGLSTHSVTEVCRAWRVRPSYIACGPIHATAAKAMPWIPQGEDNLAFWAARLPLPVVAIGGMDVPRSREAARRGATWVAVISAVTAAADPAAAIEALQAAIRVGVARRETCPPVLPRPTL